MTIDNNNLYHILKIITGYDDVRRLLDRSATHVDLNQLRKTIESNIKDYVDNFTETENYESIFIRFIYVNLLKKGIDLLRYLKNGHIEFALFDTYDDNPILEFPKILIIPDNITVIENYAFYYCRLNKVILSENLTEIGELSFSHSIIKEINLPKNLQLLGLATFSSCPNLKIKFPSNINLMTFSMSNFYENQTMTELMLPEGIKRLTIIDRDIPLKCTLQRITLPESIHSIDPNAFNLIHSLEIYYPKTTDEFKKIAPKLFCNDKNTIVVNCTDGILKYYKDHYHN